MRVLLRKDSQPLLCPQGESLTKESTTPDRDPRLNHMPTRPPGIDRGVEEDQQPLLLILSQFVPQRNRNRPSRPVRYQDRDSLPDQGPVETEKGEADRHLDRVGVCRQGGDES